MMRSINAFAVAALLIPNLAAAQVKASDAKIRSAMSAAPAALTANATIMDWPATDAGQPVELRKGTNGWTCFPDYPGTNGPDPMCLDETWLKFINAHLKHETPKIDRIGIGYMVAAGGAAFSATDPYAEKESPTNEWGHDGPHIMIVVPDASSLRGLSAKRQTASPWVMWAGTPYAHIMLPVDAKH